jgi:hypothetical protein
MAASFIFQSTATLTRYTGFSADSARSLQRGIARVPGSSIFYPVHFALFRRHFMTSEIMNDFARWTWATLGDEPLAEQLASVDPLTVTSIHEVRERLVHAIEGYLGRTEYASAVDPTARFYFIDGQSFLFPTGLSSDSIGSFAEAVRRAPVESIFHHFVAAPLRLGKRDNDFSQWLEFEQGASRAAQRIRELSPYSTDLFGLGERIAELARD